MAKQPATTEENSEPEETSPAIPHTHADQLVDTIERNRILILGGAAGLIVVVILVLVFQQVAKQRHLDAGRAFTAAAASRDIGELNGVVGKYRGSVAAGNAMLTKADVQIDQGKSQDAIATLDTFIADFPKHPRHVQAYYMLANLYHKSGDLIKAEQNYREVLSIQTDGEYSPISKIRLGDIALARGDEELARQHYNESITTFPGSPFVSMAEQRIALLAVGDPPVVDPPKEETAEQPATGNEAATATDASEKEAGSAKDAAAESSPNMAPAAGDQGLEEGVEPPAESPAEEASTDAETPAEEREENPGDNPPSAE